MNSTRLTPLAVACAFAFACANPTPAPAGGLIDPFIALPWGPTGTQFQDGFGEFVALEDVDDAAVEAAAHEYARRLERGKGRGVPSAEVACLGAAFL